MQRDKKLKHPIPMPVGVGGWEGVWANLPWNRQTDIKVKPCSLLKWQTHKLKGWCRSIKICPLFLCIFSLCTLGGSLFSILLTYGLSILRNGSREKGLRKGCSKDGTEQWQSIAAISVKTRCEKEAQGIRHTHGGEVEKEKGANFLWDIF